MTQRRVNELRKDGFITDAKSFFPVALCLALLCLFLYLNLDASPQHSLSGHVLKDQDMYCFTLGITLALFVFYLASILAYGANRFEKTVNRNQD